MDRFLVVEDVLRGWFDPHPSVEKSETIHILTLECAFVSTFHMMDSELRKERKQGV